MIAALSHVLERQRPSILLFNPRYSGLMRICAADKSEEWSRA